MNKHQKSDGGSVRSDLKKLDSFTVETSKNHLIRNFLRNGRLRVKQVYSFFVTRHSISEFKVSRFAVGVDFFFKVFFNVLRFISVKV